MATPTDPTATNIVTEAWNKAGVESPDSAQLTRAKDYFLQEIFNDIWNTSVATGNSRLKTLQETLIDCSVLGTETLALAEDFDEECEVTILDGDSRGTAQAAASTTITLASDEDIDDDVAVGKQILITSGTGVDEIKSITAYDTTTKVATIDSAWTATPTSSSTYLIVTKRYVLDEIDIEEYEGTQPAKAGRPSGFAKYGRQIIFDRPFDLSTYGIRIRYFINIHEVNLTEGASTRITRIYQNWRDTLTTGVTWKIMEYIDDNRQAAKKRDYEQSRNALLIREIPYGGAFQGFTL